jgi:hypothetical protein
MTSLKPIPQEWIKNYVNQLIDVAASLPEGKLRDATILRADHAMDLIEAFQNRTK